MATKITCPKCQFQFDIDEVLTAEAEGRLAEKLALEYEQKMVREREKLTATLAKQLAEKNRLTLEEAAAEQKLLTEKLKSRDEVLARLREQQLKLNQQKDQWELEKQSLQLENQKKLSQERTKILAAAKQQALEEASLRLAEKDKTIADFEKQIALMKQKIEQGSQQLQGEVLELALEEKLRAEFSADQIEAIGKGVNGADIRQRVVDKNGQICGVILWESKRTKNWSEGWVKKLKDDARGEAANLAVLVTTALPKTLTKSFGYYQGLWVSEPGFALQLATLLRYNLVAVHYAMASQENKDEKLEALYQYLTGPEFVQKIEALLETFALMKTDLDKERTVSTRRLNEREQQLNQLLTHTAGLYGSLQGVTKNALPEVKLLSND